MKRVIQEEELREASHDQGFIRNDTMQPEHAGDCGLSSKPQVASIPVAIHQCWRPLVQSPLTSQKFVEVSSFCLFDRRAGSHVGSPPATTQCSLFVRPAWLSSPKGLYTLSCSHPTQIRQKNVCISLRTFAFLLLTWYLLSSVPCASSKISCSMS